MRERPVVSTFGTFFSCAALFDMCVGTLMSSANHVTLKMQVGDGAYGL